MKQKSLFIFDVDGTLVNAYGAIQESLNYTLEQFDRPSVSYRRAKMAVGRGDSNFIYTFFEEGIAEKALCVFKDHHEWAVVHHTCLLPYCRFTLNNLKRKKKKLAIATNRPKKYTHLILKSLDLVKYFDFILCADEVKSFKPKPKILTENVKKFGLKREDAVFIGDTDIDMETAKRARIDAIFVKGGSSTLKDVRSYKNKRVVNNLKQVLNFA